jgi:hypothetical protein
MQHSKVRDEYFEHDISNITNIFIILIDWRTVSSSVRTAPSSYSVLTGFLLLQDDLNGELNNHGRKQSWVVLHNISTNSLVTTLRTNTPTQILLVLCYFSTFFCNSMDFKSFNSLFCAPKLRVERMPSRYLFFYTLYTDLRSSVSA